MKLLKKMDAWQDSLHSDFEQVKRMLSAKELKPSIVSLDTEAGTIRVQGSEAEPYEATLAECTCTDFSRRLLPCKHIYALAFEMGFFDSADLKKSGAESRKEFESDAGKYRSLYEAGALSADSYVKICSVLSKAK